MKNSFKVYKTESTIINYEGTEALTWSGVKALLRENGVSTDNYSITIKEKIGNHLVPITSHIGSDQKQMVSDEYQMPGDLCVKRRGEVTHDFTLFFTQIQSKSGATVPQIKELRTKLRNLITENQDELEENDIEGLEYFSGKFFSTLLGEEFTAELPSFIEEEEYHYGTDDDSHVNGNDEDDDNEEEELDDFSDDDNEELEGF